MSAQPQHRRANSLVRWATPAGKQQDPLALRPSGSAGSGSAGHTPRNVLPDTRARVPTPPGPQLPPLPQPQPQSSQQASLPNPPSSARARQQDVQEFLRALQEVPRLEAEVQQLRQMLSRASAAAAVDKGAATPAVAMPPPPSPSQGNADQAAKVRDMLQECSSAAAERRYTAALILLEKIDDAVGGLFDPAAVAAAEAEVEEVQMQLAGAVEREIGVYSSEGNGQHVAELAQLMAQMVGLHRAAEVVLSAHSSTLERQLDMLPRPADAGGADPHGSDFSAAVGQQTGAELQAAVLDLTSAFPVDSLGMAGGMGPEAGTMLVMWARKEVVK
jgi:hypothetical protein